jgi:hypothetical protein
LAKAESDLGPVGFLGPAQLEDRVSFLFFFYDLNRKMVGKWFCVHYCSKSSELNFVMFVVISSTTEKYEMASLRCFYIELYLFVEYCY